MTIRALFIRILVLALPGLVGSLFYRTLRGGRQQKEWRDLAEITTEIPQFVSSDSPKTGR